VAADNELKLFRELPKGTLRVQLKGSLGLKSISRVTLGIKGTSRVTLE